jgi:hypothetical protein
MDATVTNAENLGIGGSPAGFSSNSRGTVLPGGQSVSKGKLIVYTYYFIFLHNFNSGSGSRSGQPQFGVNFGYDRCGSTQETSFIDIIHSFPPHIFVDCCYILMVMAWLIRANLHCRKMDLNAELTLVMNLWDP